MKFSKRLFASKEVLAVLGVLDEADQRFDFPVFGTIKKQIEKAVLADADRLSQEIRDGLSPRQAVYAKIANIAGDLAESGRFHVWQGVLSPITGGEDLLRIFDGAVDEMVLIRALDQEYADEQKRRLRENVRKEG